MNAITPNLITPQMATATPAAKPTQDAAAVQGSSFAAAMQSAQDRTTQASAAPVTATASIGHAHVGKGHGGAHMATTVKQQDTQTAAATKTTTAPRTKAKSADAAASTDDLEQLSAEQTDADVEVNGDTTKANASAAPNGGAVISQETKATLKAAMTATTGDTAAAASTDDAKDKTAPRMISGATSKSATAKAETKHSKPQQAAAAAQPAQSTSNGSSASIAITPLNNVSARTANAQGAPDAAAVAGASTKKSPDPAVVPQMTMSSAAVANNAPAQSEINTDATAQASELAAIVPPSADRAGSFADKLEAATGGSIAAHGVADESAAGAGATFNYSLNGTSSLHADSSSKLAATTSSDKAQNVDATDTSQYTPAPVRRLEVAVNDPLLGNVDVRAEMRGSALHASIAGDASAVSAAMPQLHQFLEQQRVTVHSLNYTSTSSDVVRATSQSGATMSFSQGDAQSGSQTSQDTPQRQGSRNTATEWHAAFTPDSPNTGSNRSIYAGVTAGAMQMPAGSTLSIHI